ncbi:AAA family ATPase [Anabaena azotica]|uniref:AAA family ATPase n=1 Tax=Anabaena azotica TaxID=197653 RepID=UPI0039A51595
MSTISHFLVGIPGSGKSTFASQWLQYDPNCVIVSTDAIRAELFGDESQQGNWSLIEQEVLKRVKAAVAANISVVYDATNFKRSHRIDILQKFANVGADKWMAWYLKTPLKECYRRNQQRQRQVDENIIESYDKSLKQFEPIEAEGFSRVTALSMVNGEHDFSVIQKQIKSLPRSIVNRRNCSRKKILHQYSGLIDFERLMYLISLMIKFPGVGLFHETNPNFLQKLVGNTVITDSLSEISTLMSSQYHSIYAQTEALANDLEWLEKNGIIGEQGLDKDIEVDDYIGDVNKFEAHTYSDIDTFIRLIKIIRCLVHYPYFRYEEDEKKVQEMFFKSLEPHIYGITQSTLRRDIQVALHPYKILPNTTMKRAYFVGNAVLNKYELEQVYKVLHSQAKDLEDPIALSTYEGIEKKLELSQILRSEVFADDYRVRAIANQPIVDINQLPDSAAYKKLDDLTTAIVSGRALEINRLSHTGRYADNPHTNQQFVVWPLQIVFSNIGWYLGYECKGGDADKLFKFDRLDRIYISSFSSNIRSLDEQKKALSQLEILYKSSYSLHLGNSVDNQQKYLNKKQRDSVEVELQIWCKENIFNFISEGTKRIPTNQIKMSKRPGIRTSKSEKIFVLPTTGDADYPYCCQLTLPYWAIEDFDLKRWIIGFGNQVKVVQPVEIVQQIKLLGDGVSKLYS